MKEPLSSPSLEANLEDLKVIYRVLMAHRADHPELEENDFLTSLRRLLIAQATAEGVDTGDEAEWEAWLLDEEDETSPERNALN